MWKYSPMIAAAMRIALIEEAAARRQERGAPFASIGAVCAVNASTLTGAAIATERGAMPSLAAERCGAARLEEEGKKLRPRAREADGPSCDGLLDWSSACSKYSSRGIACQWVGVILPGSPFSPTHSPASADQ